MAAAVAAVRSQQHLLTEGDVGRDLAPALCLALNKRGISAMNDLDSVIGLGRDALNVGKAGEILDAIGVIRQSWTSISDALQKAGTPRTLDQWIGFLVTDIAGSEVKPVLALLGLEDERARIQGWIEKVEPGDGAKIAMLMTLVDRFPNGEDDIVKWPLLDVDQAPAGGNRVAWSFALKGKAEFELEANARWPHENELHADWLLKTSFSLDGSAEGSARLPLQFGSVALAAGASQSIALAYYARVPDRSTPFALAAANSMKALANPLSFDSLWLRLSSEGLLDGVTLDYAADLHATISVGIVKGLSTSLADVSVTAAVDVGVRWPSDFSMALWRGRALQHGNGVAIAVSRKRAVNRSIGAELGIKLDLSRAAAELHKRLQEVFDLWSDGVETIKPFLTPGTYLRDALAAKLDGSIASLVNDADLAAALREDARIALGLDAQSSSKLSQWLRTLFIDKIDTYATGFAADANKVVGDSAAQILDALPLVRQSGLADKVSGEIQTLVAALKGAFDTQLEALWEQSEDKAALGAALAKAGNISSEAVRDLNDLTARVVTLVDYYDALFRDLLDTVSDTAKAQISLSLSIQEVRDAGSSYEFAGEFLDGGADSKSLFAALLAGGFQTVADQLSAVASPAYFQLDREKSSISRFSNWSRTSSFQLLAFDFGISAKTILMAGAKATINGMGAITLDLSGSAARETSKGANRRSFEFLTAASIRRVKSIAANPALLTTAQSLAFRLTYDEKSLTRGELNAFLSDFTAATIGTGAAQRPMLSTMGSSSAQSALNGWIASTGPNAGVAARIEMQVVIAPSRLAAILARPSPDEQAMFDTAFRRFQANGTFSEENWKEFRRLNKQYEPQLAKNVVPQDGDAAVRNYGRMRSATFRNLNGVPLSLGPRNTGTLHALGYLAVWYSIRYAQSFVDLIVAMHRIYAFVPTGDLRADEAAGRTWEEQIVKSVWRIASTGANRIDDLSQIGRAFTYEQGVSGRTMAFLELLHGYFEISEPSLLITLSQRDGENIKSSITFE